LRFIFYLFLFISLNQATQNRQTDNKQIAQVRSRLGYDSNRQTLSANIGSLLMEIKINLILGRAPVGLIFAVIHGNVVCTSETSLKRRIIAVMIAILSTPNCANL